jgi:hypothetical protein
MVHECLWSRNDVHFDDDVIGFIYEYYLDDVMNIAL